MLAEDVKQRYSMESVLNMYGLQVKRGFCQCPFHKGDREPSMKVYKDSYHCYGCGANGDIFTFVQEYEGVDFKTAFQKLGGNYRYKFSEYRKMEAARKQRLKEKEESEEKNRYKKRLAEKITLFRRALTLLDPTDDAYWYIYLKNEIALYEWEEVDY